MHATHRGGNSPGLDDVFLRERFPWSRGDHALVKRVAVARWLRWSSMAASC